MLRVLQTCFECKCHLWLLWLLACAPGWEALSEALQASGARDYGRMTLAHTYLAPEPVRLAFGTPFLGKRPNGSGWLTL